MNDEDLKNICSRLPRFPGLLDKKRYFNAAVLIPLIKKDQDYHFLFEKRAAHIRQGGEISFPGGAFEPGNDHSCQEAAIRETEEELGIDRDSIRIQGRCDTYISPRGITVDSFLAVLELDETSLKPDKNEVEEIFLLPVSWFVDNPPREFHLNVEIQPYATDDQGSFIDLLPVDELGIPSQYKQSWQGLSHRVYVYSTPKAVIWGITAELVRYVVDRLMQT
jgi:8-oxo-dGTP pyrophosphatase MutT (NUDIX family)